MMPNDLNRQSLSFVLKINSHQDSARNFLPTATLPKFRATLVIIGHHDNNAFHSSLAEPIEAFVQQTLTQSASLIGRINRQMVDVSAVSIVAAQSDSNNCRSIECDPAQL